MSSSQRGRRREVMLMSMSCEEVRQHAQAEGLTLRKTNSTSGFVGVHLQTQPGQPKPYQARVQRGGTQVHLGSFSTAEEAALCVARSPEGQAVAAGGKPAVAALTSEEVRQQAQAEGLTLVVAENKTGYFGVHLPYPGQRRPYQGRVRRGVKTVNLGSFATAEEAALGVARSPEGQTAAQKAAALTSEEAQQQAQAEGLTLRKANYNSTSGYFGVHFKPSQPKPYAAQMRRGGKLVHLGTFATAEEAALCVARSPEAGRAATAAPPLTSEEARGSRRKRRG